MVDLPGGAVNDFKQVPYISQSDQGTPTGGEQKFSSSGTISGVSGNITVDNKNGRSTDSLTLNTSNSTSNIVIDPSNKGAVNINAGSAKDDSVRIQTAKDNPVKGMKEVSPQIGDVTSAGIKLSTPGYVSVEFAKGPPVNLTGVEKLTIEGAGMASPRSYDLTGANNKLEGIKANMDGALKQAHEALTASNSLTQVTLTQDKTPLGQMPGANPNNGIGAGQSYAAGKNVGGPP